MNEEKRIYNPKTGRSYPVRPLSEGDVKSLWHKPRKGADDSAPEEAAR